MPQYVTPDRYRNMALGIDLSEKTDPELGALLASASAEVNRWCAAPVGHDFRGGSVEREEHIWDQGNSHYYPSGRLWPKHGHGVMPITACSQIDIYSTKTNYIRFQEGTIMVNSRLGYVEPVAAPITTALFTSIPPFLLSAPIAYVDYEYGRTYTVTGEILYALAGGRMFQATNQWWTDDEVEVTVDGTPTTEYTVDLDEGVITLNEAPTYGTPVKASYVHKLPFEIAMGTAVIATDMLGYSNINASGLGGLSGIKVEEIELRQSSKAGFNNYNLHPAAKMYLGAFVYVSMA